MGPLIPLLAMLLLAPPLVVVFVAWRWLVRSGHRAALGPFLGSSIAGGIALLAFLMAIACFLNLATHTQHHAGRGGAPVAGILMVLSVLVFGVTALITVALGIWTLVKVNSTPRIARPAP